MYFIVNFLKIKVYTPYSSLEVLFRTILKPGSQAAGENLPELIFAALASAQLPTFPSESLPFIAHPSTKP